MVAGAPGLNGLLAQLRVGMGFSHVIDHVTTRCQPTEVMSAAGLLLKTRRAALQRVPVRDTMINDEGSALGQFYMPVGQEHRPCQGKWDQSLVFFRSH